jgi:hypothetical protein
VPYKHAYLSRAHGFNPGFLYWVRVAYHFNFLCCVFVLFVFVLYLVPKIDFASGLAILDCPFGLCQCVSSSDDISEVEITKFDFINKLLVD